MTRLAASFIALLVLALLALPAAAVAREAAAPHAAHITAQQEGQGGDEAPSGEHRDGLNDVVIWTIAALGIFAAVMGTFYFFKRQVGGFPEHPSWVAPITIMRSEEFPDEGDFGDQVPSQQAHAEH